MSWIFRKPGLSTGIILFLLFLLRPLDDYDIFTQISLGREMLLQGNLLSTEPFLLNSSSPLWFNPGWLWQLLAAWLTDTFSLQILRHLHILVFVFAILLSFYSTKELEKQPMPYRGFLEATTLAILPLLTSTSVRPQVIAFLCFAAVFNLLKTREYSLSRNIFILFICLLWQNIHSSVLLALPLTLLADSKKGLFSCWKRERILLFCGCALTNFCTPLGMDVFLFSSENYHISRSIFQITEWYGYFELPLSFLPAFGMSLLLLVVALGSTFRKQDSKDIILVFGFALVTILAIRFVVFWALVALPLYRETFHALSPGILPSDRLAEIPRQLKGILFLLLAGFLITFDWKVPLVANHIPEDCLLSLDQVADNSIIFNDYRWGGLISYQEGTRLKIVADGRLYLQSPSYWKSYFQDSVSNPDLNSIEERYNPEVLVISENLAPQLILLAARSPHWQLLKQANDCTIFVTTR